MDLSLGRFDLTVVGSTHRHTTRVLTSASSKKKQKIVVGDDTGTLTCFQYKTKDYLQVFKTVPGPREITALSVGGTRTVKDKIYVAWGQTIQGYTKQGKLYGGAFNTSLNEDIFNMFHEEKTVFTSCEYIMNIFENEKDLHLYMAPDKINHMAIGLITHSDAYNSVLACQDKCVRILKDSDLLHQVAVEGPVTSLFLPEGFVTVGGPTDGGNDGNDELKGETREMQLKQIIYGTDNGMLGQLLVDASASRRGFVVENDAKKAGITCMNVVVVADDGVPDLVVGRDDGTLEIFGFEMGDPVPHQHFVRELGESITAIDRGHILGLDHDDLVVTTYSGKVLCYTQESTSNVAHIGPKKSATAKDAAEAKAMRAENEKKIVGLKNELEKLREALKGAQEKYSKLSTEMIAVDVQFKTKSSLKLLPDEACYLVTLEIGMPIDVVTLQSAVPAMLLDTTSNLAMVSRTPADRENGNALLATYRCQDNTNRLEIKIRAVEGEHGPLNAYIIPKQAPKTCQRASFQIKPLSLHEKVLPEVLEPMMKSRVLNTLTLTGAFSLNEVHAWIGTCLPDVPPRITDEVGKLCFRSTFLHTVLIIDYIKGRAVFVSDSITVISIIKEVVTKEATAKRVAIEPSLDIKDDSIYNVLELLRPELDKYSSLERRHRLLEPLAEIKTHEEDCSFLSDEYKSIIDNADSIKREVKLAPRHLDFLKGIVTDLYADKHKLRGRRVIEKRVEMLAALLRDYSFPALITFFKDGAVE